MADISNLDSIKHFKLFLNRINQLTVDLQKLYPDNILCKDKCSECCKKSIINISIIEGYYLQNAFNMLQQNIKEQIEAKIRKNIDLLTENTDNKNLIECPLLIENSCVLYEERPIICRVYGYPLTEETTGQIATCHKNFQSLRDKDYTLQTISTKALNIQSIILSQYLLKELGKDIPDDFIPPLFSISEILSSSIE